MIQVMLCINIFTVFCISSPPPFAIVVYFREVFFSHLMQQCFRFGCKSGNTELNLRNFVKTTSILLIRRFLKARRSLLILPHPMDFSQLINFGRESPIEDVSSARLDETPITIKSFNSWWVIHEKPCYLSGTLCCLAAPVRRLLPADIKLFLWLTSHLSTPRVTSEQSASWETSDSYIGELLIRV